MIYVGTSGYSYRDWVGAFYPADLPRYRWLHFYAQFFPAVELNFTYYRPPDARTLARMVEQVPEGFLFAVKAPREVTHERQADAGFFQRFAESLRPLVEAGVLGAVLLQFPYSFHRSEETCAYLRRCRQLWPDLPLVVEFRNREWLTQRTLALLREEGLSFCNVDMPPLSELIPPTALVTASPAYVRFHGRNKEKWWQHQNAWERYNYRYSDEELAEWVPRIREIDGQVERTFVFANNHWQGQAVETARALRRLLGLEEHGELRADAD